MFDMSIPHQKCPLCNGNMVAGVTTFSVDLEFGLVVVREVPARECDLCGEAWIEDQTAAVLEKIVQKARREKRQVEILLYAGAPDHSAVLAAGV